MKFGRNLSRNVVPEWSASYINYKALKKLIKSAAEDVKAGEKPDLAAFFYSLDRNVEDVDYFYNKKFADFSRRLKLLEDRYGYTRETGPAFDTEDVEDLLTALLELRGQGRKLQWYAEINRRGFIKITKKLDKKVGAKAQKTYLESKLDPMPFASNTRLLGALDMINNWLSVLGDQKVLDDACSTRSSLSLNRVSSYPNIDLSSALLRDLDLALGRDDASGLQDILKGLRVTVNEATEVWNARVMKIVLQRALHHRARSCITLLLGAIDNLDEEDDINKRNCIHRLVISIGRSLSTADSEHTGLGILDFSPESSKYITPATQPTLQPSRTVPRESNQLKLLTRDDPSVSLLQYLLDELRPQQRKALLARDMPGRTPLHYGAQYGFKVVCEIIIEHLQAWDMFDVSEGIDGPSWQDNEGWAPLHLSVVGGHPLTTRALLDAENWKGPNQDKVAMRRDISKSGAVLALATKANFVDIIQLLVDAGVDVNYQDQQGETALHVAARFGHSRCAKILLAGSEEQKANTELAENTYSWTPLFIACVDGSLDVVNLLIEAGADLNRFDSSGWTAKEHAALRGHIHIATRLAQVIPEPQMTELELIVPVPDRRSPSSSPPSHSSLTDRRSNGTASGGSFGSKGTEAVKTFGHRYLTDESMILVSLGTMDMRRTSQPVNLDRIPMQNAHSTQLDTALSLVISASGAHGEPEVFDLPIHENISTEPVAFHTKDATKARLLFDLIPTYAGAEGKILGRGVALLSSIKQTVGSHRINLKGDSTVPILAASTMEVIGSVTFNFLIITPFTHPNLAITGNKTYWKTMSSPMVIGHRGLGKNIASRKSLQLGENTIQSFIAAANLGASYVEFDVQLTKDHVPVIYHDFLVSETGIDAPVHALTLEQFLQLSENRPYRFSRSGSPLPTLKLNGTPNRSSPGLKQRSMSVGGSEFDTAELDERIKYTRDFKKKGFKGNSRGHHIQAPFATLEELFRKLPPSVGFNMELKYPMLHESEEEEMDTLAVELNSFVDTVLAKVYEHGQGRNMIFSSFNPDICLLLSFKQPSIPVMFLTDAGTSPVGDIRASSLQEAIRFASRWNLLGVVSAAEPLVLCPRLVKAVKASGLVCVSYGGLNNDPSNVKLQVAEGIDAVIVDSVLAVRKGLTEAQNSKGTTPVPSPQPVPTKTSGADSYSIPLLN